MQTYSYALNFDPVLILYTDFAEKSPILSRCWNGWFDSAHIIRQNQRQFQECLARDTRQCQQLFALAIPFNAPVRQLGPLLSLEFSLDSPDTQFSPNVCSFLHFPNSEWDLPSVLNTENQHRLCPCCFRWGCAAACFSPPASLLPPSDHAKADVSLCSRAAGWYSAQGEVAKLLSFCFDELFFFTFFFK